LQTENNQIVKNIHKKYSMPKGNDQDPAQGAESGPAPEVVTWAPDN